jgi:dihydropteroate synthase
MSNSVWTLRTRGEEYSFNGPQVMGIVNLTPDSFYDGGVVSTTDQLHQQIMQMVSDGATFIDVGAESTRPGSDPVSQEEELSRLSPFFSLLSEGRLPREPLYSIDTTKAEVAKEAVRAGCHLVNSVSGQLDPTFLEVANQYSTAYVCMHAQGAPKTMQDNPSYGDVVEDVKQFIEEFILHAPNAAPSLGSIIIDPGFGFGKRLEDNLHLMNHLDEFVEYDHPVLVGVSRKSMIASILDGQSADDRLNGTTVLHTVACLAGVHILRVHDVKEAVETTRIVSALHKGRSAP